MDKTEIRQNTAITFKLLFNPVFNKQRNYNETIAQNISTKYRPHQCPALIFKDPSHGQVFKPETSGKHQNPSNEHSRKEIRTKQKIN